MDKVFLAELSFRRQLAPLLDRSLQNRCRSTEVMDDRSLELFELEPALESLERFNKIAATAAGVWRIIKQMPGKISILDIGCGRGDLLFDLEKRAAKEGLSFKGLGLDWNDRILALAQDRASTLKSSVQFKKFDVFCDELPEGFDVAVTSLFLHHLNEGQVLKLLKRASKKVGRIVISDLVRSRFNYLLTLAGTRLLSKSKIVQIDGPLSVRAAFTVSEIKALLEDAGLNRFKIKRQFPGRFLISIST